jgi:hypothetical protein
MQESRREKYSELARIMDNRTTVATGAKGMRGRMMTFCTEFVDPCTF